MPADPFIEIDELAALGPVRYLDARVEAAFDDGHIPNAIFVPSNDWDKAAKTPGSGFENTAYWEAALSAIGIDNTATHVVYDTGIMTDAARAWFILQYFGVKVVILNGGWWPLSQAQVPEGVGPGHGFMAKAGAGPVGVVDRATLKSQLDHAAHILDTRSWDEFIGADRRDNPRSGHIPGARQLTHTDLLDKGRIKPPEEVRDMLNRVGFRPANHIVAHCQGGARAAFGAAAAIRAGFEDVRVYYLSFGDWAKDDTCPIVRN